MSDARLHQSLVLVTGSSSQEPVSLAETKVHLKASTSTEEDDLITGFISAARRRLENETNRAFLKQTFEQWGDAFPSDDEDLKLPRSPLVSVSAVKGYTDTDGVTDTGGKTMSSSEYIVDTKSEPGRVRPLAAYSWPTATRTINAAVVAFTAGYSSQPSGLPDTVRTAVLQLTAHFWARRGDEDFDPDLAPLPPVVRILIDDLRLPEVG